MSTFVIAERCESDLCSPIFRAGCDESEESAALFTTRTLAETYVRHAGWMETNTVAELDAEDLLHWVLSLKSDGVQYLAVNPDRREHEERLQQMVLTIDDLVADATQNLGRLLSDIADAQVTDLLRINIYHCQDCGRVSRRRPENTTPTCCQEEMEFAAPDAVPA